MRGTKSHGGVAMDARVVPPVDEGVSGAEVGERGGEAQLAQEAQRL